MLLFGFLVAVVVGCLFHVTEADTRAYQQLEASSETSRQSGESRAFACRQRREGVNKLFLLADKDLRRPCQLSAASSEVTIKRKSRGIVVYETLRGVTCDALEEVLAGDEGQTAQQRLFHLEADQATYDYRRGILSARGVMIVRHELPVGDTYSPWPSGRVMMTGYAPSARFHVLQRKVEASQLRGTLYASEVKP